MMILSQDGMVAVNSDNVVMFEVKESETLPRETRLCATILITNGARFSRSIGTFHSTDRTELAKLALDYIFVQYRLRPQGLCAGSDRR